MTLEYKISANDYLTCYLYNIYRSKKKSTEKWNHKLNVPLFYLLIGLVFLIERNFSLCILFSMTSVFWYFYYPKWEKRNIIKQCKSIIIKNFEDFFDKPTLLEINEIQITIKNIKGEINILNSEIIEINEIPSALYIKDKSEKSIIIPKRRIIEIDSKINWLKEFALTINVPYNIDNEWTWK